jgi:hypothetical protein
VVFAQTLSLRLAVENRATHPLIFEEALHAYFAISDISGIAISGLATTTYIDKTDALRRKAQTTALVTVTAETDSVYLDTPGQCAIEDRGWRRRVIIEKDGAASTVVWNPWSEKGSGNGRSRRSCLARDGLRRDREYRRQRDPARRRWRTPDVDDNLARRWAVTFWTNVTIVAPSSGTVAAG